MGSTARRPGDSHRPRPGHRADAGGSSPAQPSYRDRVPQDLGSNRRGGDLGFSHADVARGGVGIATQQDPGAVDLVQAPVLELLLAPGVWADGVAVATKFVFVGRKSLKTHGPSRVELAGADADLGAQSVAVAICEACRSVVEDAGGIHLVQESSRRLLVLGHNRLVPQKRFYRVADRRILDLGVIGDIDCLVQVGSAIHIYMANSLAMPQDRYPAVLHDELDQSVGSARDNQVHIAVQGQHFFHVGACFQQADRIGGNNGKPAQTFAPDGHQCLIGVGCLDSALEQDGIAGLQRKRCKLWNGVGPGFKDDAHNAKWTRLLTEHQAIVELRERKRATQRIVQARYLADLRGHLSDSAIGDSESIEHRRGDSSCVAVGLCGAAVAFIGIEDLASAVLNRLRNGNQQLVARLNGKFCDRTRGYARSPGSGGDGGLRGFDGRGDRLAHHFSNSTILSRVTRTGAGTPSRAPRLLFFPENFSASPLAQFAMPRANSRPSASTMLTTSSDAK